MTLVLGVDSSTSGCVVEIRDADTGALVSSGRAPHSPVMPPRCEQHPTEWEAAFADACAQADVDRHRPAAIAVAGQLHGLVILDAAGDVVRPAKLWNDTEAAADAGWLLGQLDGGAGAWASACGSVPTAAFAIAKLSWLHRKEPDAFARIGVVLSPHDWLTYRLTGTFTTDRGDASTTGYWSPAENRYRLDLLQIVDGETDWEAALPRVAAPTEAVGEWARTGAMVAPGTGDAMAAALGLGLRTGDAGTIIGSGAMTLAVSDTAVADESGAVAGLADATGRFLRVVRAADVAEVTDSVVALGAAVQAAAVLHGQPCEAVAAAWGCGDDIDRSN